MVTTRDKPVFWGQGHEQILIWSEFNGMVQLCRWFAPATEWKRKLVSSKISRRNITELACRLGMSVSYYYCKLLPLTPIKLHAIDVPQ
jgi:hypothetical protein